MLVFCPQCGNMLAIDATAITGGRRFSCKACPFVYEIAEPLVARTYMKKKEVDDILGGEKAWENVDRIEARCPKCEHGTAYFMQIQTRSADEPSTIFYKCCNHSCNFQWNDR